MLTFPHSLRYRLAWDGDLLAGIHKAVIDRIYRFIRASLSIKFKRKDLRPGSISFIQRCGSLLNLNLHFQASPTASATLLENLPRFCAN
jgi:hypothetical protein